MWLMTTRGFYSAVQHRDDPTKLLIRARSEKHIRNLADLLPDAEPWKLTRSDYEWRIEVTAAEWALVASQLVLEIDYANFKTAVGKVDPQAASVYHRCWSALLGLERVGRWKDKFKKGKIKNRPAGQRTLPSRNVIRCNCSYGRDSGGIHNHALYCRYGDDLAEGDLDNADFDNADFPNAFAGE